jgi:ubiquinone/menaquinone biosynthesis C-methylase UbiE
MNVINQSINGQSLRMTHGTLSVYQDIFELDDINKVEGPILDVGTGLDSLSTRSDFHRTTLHYFEGNNRDVDMVNTHNLVTADGRNLPYPSNYFKNIFLSYSLPMYYLKPTDTGKQYDFEKTVDLFTELYRVMQTGGTAYIFPVHLEKLAEVMSVFKGRFKAYRHDSWQGCNVDADNYAVTLILEKI